MHPLWQTTDSGRTKPNDTDAQNERQSTRDNNTSHEITKTDWLSHSVFAFGDRVQGLQEWESAFRGGSQDIDSPRSTIIFQDIKDTVLLIFQDGQNALRSQRFKNLIFSKY